MFYRQEETKKIKKKKCLNEDGYEHDMPLSRFLPTKESRPIVYNRGRIMQLRTPLENKKIIKTKTTGSKSLSRSRFVSSQ